MNKTITANIAGFVFHLDETAYEQFQKYLKGIRSSLTGTEGVDEIMQDIESRIAEMLRERISDPLQVVSLEDVHHIMQAMGQPEEFGNGEAKETIPPLSRKLFRDPDDKLLGGVCSGIGAYFDVDAVWIRLFFAFLLFGLGTGILFYILLWIILPEAKTTADKLRMRGDPVTISNIEKNVREEMDQIKVRAEEYTRSGKFTNLIRRFLNGVADVMAGLIRLITKVAAAIFLLLGLFVSFVLFAVLFAMPFQIEGISDIPVVVTSIFSEPRMFQFSAAALVLAIGIPFIALAALGARMLFNLKISRGVSMTVLVIWLLSIGALMVLGIFTFRQFRVEENVRSVVTWSNPPRTLILKADSYGEGHDSSDDDETVLFKHGPELWGDQVMLNVVRSPDTLFHLVQEKISRGSDRSDAIKNAESIRYFILNSDSTLVLDRFFKLDESSHFRNQHLKLTLQIPEGSSVFLDRSLTDMLHDVKNLQNVYDRDMVGRTWEMKTNELDCLDCDGSESQVDKPTSSSQIIIVQ